MVKFHRYQLTESSSELFFCSPFYRPHLSARMEYYTDYHFTSNVTDYTCPRNGNTTEHKCEPPNACAREPTEGRVYCCDYKGEQCWTSTSTCTNGRDTLRCSGSTRKSAQWCCSYELSVFIFIPPPAFKPFMTCNLTRYTMQRDMHQPG